MRKLNLAGEEPFLYPDFLAHLTDFCKEDLNLESGSIVTNGGLVREKFLAKHGHHIDILAVSCDSFDEETNRQIGRGTGDQVTILYKIAGWCRKFGVKFKVNTVICKLNVHEDMSYHMNMLQPFRWKCFEVLMVAGENNSDQTIRDVRKFMISDKEYEEFCERHLGHPAFVPESNKTMAQSYLILDEYIRFLDRDGREPSPSTLDVGVEKALSCVFWGEKGFVERGGIYDWKRTVEEGCGSATEVDW